MYVLSLEFIELTQQNFGNPSLTSNYYIYESNNPYKIIIYYIDGETEIISLNEMPNKNIQNIYRVSLGENLTELTDNFFKGYSSLTNITLPNNILTIGNNCFEDCANLRVVSLSNKLISIGDKSFKNCSNLTSIFIPKTVMTIDNECFSDCTLLSSIIFENCNALTYTGNSIFNNIINTITFTLQGNYSKLNLGSPALINIISQNPNNPFPLYDNNYYIYDPVTSKDTIIYYNDYTSEIIGENFVYTAIKGNKSKAYYVSIGNNVSSLSNLLFSDFTSLTSIIIPDSVINIGDKCFKNCNKLQEITLSINLGKLSDNCFENCSSLTGIYINRNITDIGNNCFKDCITLTSIFFENCNNIISCGTNIFNNIVNPIYMRLQGLLNKYYITSSSFISLTLQNINSQLNSSYYIYDLNMTNYIDNLGNKTTTIPENKSNIYGIELDTRLTVLDDYYLKDYINITSIIIPNSVTTIGKGCFQNCTGLTQVTLSIYLANLFSECFKGCSSLSYLYLPLSLINIDSMCFSQCTLLNKLEFENCNNLANVGSNVFNGISNTITMKLNGLFNRYGIYSSSFINLTNQNPGISIPELDSTYYEYEPANNFTTLFYLNNTSSIINTNILSSDAINNVVNLTRIIISSTVTTISNNCFQNCINLRHVDILGNINYIGNNAFYNCSSLDKLLFINDSITHIGDYCFADCNNLFNINLSNNLTYLGINAFENCYKILDISLPNSLITIKDNLFKKCTALTSVFIPSSIVTIEDNAFFGCKNLSSLVFKSPNNLTYCGNNIFANIDKSIFITLNGIMSKLDIYSVAFKYLTEQNPNKPNLDSNYYIYSRKLNNTTYYDINGNEVTTINNIINITVGTLNNKIPNNEFSEYINLESIYIPDSITEFGNECFKNCSNLKRIFFEDVNKFVICGTDIFKNMVSPITFILHGLNNSSNINTNSAINILYLQNPRDELNNIPSLTGQYFIYDTLESQTIYNYFNNSSYGYDSTDLTTNLIINKDLLKSVIVGPNVTIISDNAFEDCKNLEYISISQSVTLLGNNCFNACSSLKDIIIHSNNISFGNKCFYSCISLNSINFPQVIKSYGNSCFEGCIKLDNIQINEGTTYLGNYCFSNCISLTKLTLASTLKSIGNNCFKGSNNIDKFIFNNVNTLQSCGNNLFDQDREICTVVIKGLYNSSEITSDAFKYFALQNSNIYNLDSLLYEYDVPTPYNNPTKFYYNDNLVLTYPNLLISSSLINSVQSLTTVTIGPFVTSIDNYTFSNCIILKSVDIEEPINTVLTYIGNSAFSNCKLLTNINFLEGLITIEDYAFTECVSLQNITLPNTLTKIGAFSFHNCTTLITIDNLKATNILNGAFSGCIKLKNIILPLNIDNLSGSLFKNCSSLTSIIIPNNVTVIGSNCFYECNSLTNILINNNSSLNSIESNAFSNCALLTHINIPSSLTKLDSNCFDACINLTSITFNSPNNLIYCGENLFDNITNYIYIRLIGLNTKNDITSGALLSLLSQLPGNIAIDSEYIIYDS